MPSNSVLLTSLSDFFNFVSGSSSGGMKTMMFDQNVQHFIDFPLGKRKGNPLGKRKGIFSDFSDF